MKKGMFEFYMKSIRGLKYKIVFLFFLAVLGGLLQAFQPLALKYIVDSIEISNSNKSSIILQVPFLTLVSLLLLREIVIKMQSYFSIELSIKMRTKLRSCIYKQVLHKNISDFNDTLKGTLSNKINNLVGSFEKIFEILMNNYVPVLILYIATIYFLLDKMPVISCLVFIWGIAFCVCSSFFSSNCLKYASSAASSSSNINGLIVDALNNLRSVKSYSRESYELENLEKKQNEETETYLKLRHWVLKLQIIQSAFTVVFTLSVFYLLFAQLQRNQITYGDLSFCLQACFMLIYYTWWMGGQIITFKENIGIFNDSHESLSYSGENLNSSQNISILGTPDILLKKVTFKYPKNEMLFTFPNLHFKPGEKIGIVGHSGSGKTTFVNLIMGVHPCLTGKIRIGSTEVLSTNRSSLQREITYVQQEPWLFHRSIFDNICYGNINASFDKIVWAAQQVGLHDFVESLPSKYETMVGENGIKLSGGQRQMINLARALLKPSKVLVLDEITSHLDSLIEEKLKRAIIRLAMNKTTFIITHRLSTISIVDRILVLSNGTIVEEGSHDDLIKKNGHYAALWDAQSKGLFLTAA